MFAYVWHFTLINVVFGRKIGRFGSNRAQQSKNPNYKSTKKYEISMSELSETITHYARFLAILNILHWTPTLGSTFTLLMVKCHNPSLGWNLRLDSLHIFYFSLEPSVAQIKFFFTSYAFSIATRIFNIAYLRIYLQTNAGKTRKKYWVKLVIMFHYNRNNIVLPLLDSDLTLR